MGLRERMMQPLDDGAITTVGRSQDEQSDEVVDTGIYEWTRVNEAGEAETVHGFESEIRPFMKQGFQFEQGKQVGSMIPHDAGRSQDERSGQPRTLAERMLQPADIPSAETRPAGSPMNKYERVEEPGILGWAGAQARALGQGAIAAMEVPRDVVYGAIGGIAAIPAKHLAIASQRVQQKLGILPEMTPEEQLAMGRDVEEWVATIGGLAGQSTEVGEQAMSVIAWPFQKLHELSHGVTTKGLDALGVTKESHPWVHEAMGDNLELALTFALPGAAKRAAKASRELGKAASAKSRAAATRWRRRAERSGKDLYDHVEEVLEKKPALLEDLQTAFMRRQAELNKPGLQQSLIEARAEGGLRTRPLPGERPVEPKAPRDMTPEAGRKLSAEEALATRRIRDGERPAGAVELDTPPPEVTRFRAALVPEETVRPGATYDAGQPGTPKVGSAVPTRVWDARTGKRVGGTTPRTVWQVIKEHSGGESGSFAVGDLVATFGKAPKAASLLKRLTKELQIGMDDLMLSGVGAYLKEQGQKRIDWKEVQKIADSGMFDVRKEVLSDTPLREASTKYEMAKQAYDDNMQKLKEKLEEIHPDIAPLTSAAMYREAAELYPDLVAENRRLGEALLDASDAHEAVRAASTRRKPRYADPDYNLPGSKEGSYKETLYKYDPSDGETTYHENHWGDRGENVLAHDRRAVRTVETPDGPREVVHLEEVQSKWHKEGASKGYGDGEILSSIRALQETYTRIREEWRELNDSIVDPPPYKTSLDELGKHPQARSLRRMVDLQREMKTITNKIQELRDADLSVPDAPLKKNWPAMIARDAIRDAVQGGQDGISWTTSGTQIARWGNRPMPTRDAIYDKYLPKWFKKEFGVKAERVPGAPKRKGADIPPEQLVETPPWMDAFLEAEEASRIEPTAKVWYVPITEKMRRLYRDSTLATVFDQLVAPLRGEGGFIRVRNPLAKRNLRKKMTEGQREKIRELGRQVEKSGMGVDDYLRGKGFSRRLIREFKAAHEAVKIGRPMAAGMTPPERVKGDFLFDRLREGDVQENVDSRFAKAVPVGRSDAKKFFSLEVPTDRALTTAFKNPEYFFQRFPAIKALLDQKREIDLAYKRELEIQTEHLKELTTMYSKKKLREEIGAAWHAKSPLGARAMEAMGEKIVDLDSHKYAGLVDELQPLFEDLFKRVNETRVALGRKPIRFQKDYLAFFARESFLQDVFGLFTGKWTRGGWTSHTPYSLILDPLDTIEKRHNQSMAGETSFRHMRRRGLDSGVKLELDPIVVYDRYMKTATRHVQYSPMVAWLREMTAEKMTMPDGRKRSLWDVNAPVARYLEGWGNEIAGISNLPTHPKLDRYIHQLSSNLTAAVLGASLRTALVQPLALLGTYVEHGTYGVARAVVDTTLRLGDAPVKESPVLRTRTMDPILNDLSQAIAGTRRERMGAYARRGGTWLLRAIDEWAAEVAFRAEWRALQPHVKAGRMSRRQAIRRADSMVVRTQASGVLGELAPIQRNALGKALTLWQTYTINQANWMARNVLGLKNPKANPGRTAARMLRLTLGIAAINTLTEDLAGVSSPYPAPIKTFMRGMEKNDDDLKIALNVLKEMGDIVPLLGSAKYGSSPLGGLVDYVDEVWSLYAGNDPIRRDMMVRAKNGDERAWLAIIEALGKGRGIVGTNQATKYLRNKLRGEENELRALIGGAIEQPRRRRRSGGARGISGLGGVKGISGI